MRRTRRCSHGWGRSAAKAETVQRLQLVLRPRAGERQRKYRHCYPEDRADPVGEDEPSAPDSIGRQVIDQRAHANLSFSGLRG